MRRRDDSDVHRDVHRAAHAAERARLEHAQELGLELRRHLPDLVQEQRAAVGELEQALPEAFRVGERPALVAVQLALEQRLGDRAAIELHERSAGPGALVVQVARHELLAGAGLAVDQHRRGARLGRALEPRQRVLEPVRIADDLQLAGRALAQPAHLEAQSRMLERPVEHDAQVAQVGRLEHEVVGAELDRAHRLLHGAVPGQHDDRQRGIGVAQVFQHPQAVLVAELQVEHHRVDAALAHRLERLPAGGGLERGEALVPRPLSDAEAEGALVIDDEKCALRLRAGRAVAFRHFASPAGS